MKTASLQPNDVAPDVILLDLDGQSIRLASMWQERRSALLVFLRHLG
ncbi:MAG: hypothetical protein L0287_33575 [Anaerolineae bacterium]|nr:hypothetical protein [Anaerolineae bacterium]